MTSVKIPLSHLSEISISQSETNSPKDGMKIVLSKDEIVPTHSSQKHLLKKTRIEFTRDEYNMLKLSLESIDGILNYNAFVKENNKLTF